MVLQSNNIALKSPWLLFVEQLEIKFFSKSKSHPTVVYVPLEFSNAVNRIYKCCKLNLQMLQMDLNHQLLPPT